MSDFTDRFIRNGNEIMFDVSGLLEECGLDVYASVQELEGYIDGADFKNDAAADLAERAIDIIIDMQDGETPVVDGVLLTVDTLQPYDPVYSGESPDHCVESEAVAQATFDVPGLA